MEYIDSFRHYASNCGIENVSCRQADLVEYVPDSKFDLITAIDILEHIEEDVKVLKNFRRSLNKGGKLIITSPSNFDESAIFTEEHVRAGYSKEEIISKLEKTGFRIVSFEYTYGKSGKIYWNLTLKIPLSLLEKSRIFIILLPFYYFFFYPLSFVFMLLDMKIKNKLGTGIMVVAE
jgi:SAM-dependent methyltransferase